jgi:hypothetical protein
MASFKFDEIPESNKNINFEFKMKDNKCVDCKNFYGVLVDGKYLCSKCSGLMKKNLNSRKSNVMNFISKYSIIDNKNFVHFRFFCGKLKNMYSPGGKLTIELLCKILRRYILLMLSGNTSVHDNWKPLFSYENPKKIDEIKELKYLFSLEQCNEILNLFRYETFSENFHFISHCMARYLKTPWIQSNLFHPSSMCYHGNFGEVKYCGYEKFYYENHFCRLSPK